LQDPIAEAIRQEHIRAVAEYKRSDDHAAINRYRRVLCADPNDRLATENLVWLATRGDLTSALAARVGGWAIRQFPDNLRLEYMTGRTLFWRGEIGAAIPLLGTTATQGPDPARAFSMLGHALTLRDGAQASSFPEKPIAPASGEQLVIFARDAISLDHALPVLWRWREDMDRHAVVVMIGDIDADDWRARAIKSLPRAHIHSLRDLSASFDLNRVLHDLLNGSSRGFVMFDRSSDVIARILRGIARRHSAAFVSLPHGEEPYVNRLTNVDSKEIDDAPSKGFDLYDLTLVSSTFTIEKYRLSEQANIAVTGSARYCGAWLKIREAMRSGDSGLPETSGLRVVAFLPKPEKIVDWPELSRFLAILARRDDVTLLAQRHARTNLQYRLIQESGDWTLEPVTREDRTLPETFNDPLPEAGWRTAASEVDASALISWANLVLALGTSVTWEAVMRRKPVLELSWCHGNHSTLARFLPATDMRSRDDAIAAINAISRDGPEGFYPDAEWKNFVERFIEPPDGTNVLDMLIRVLDTVSPGEVTAAAKPPTIT